MIYEDIVSGRFISRPNRFCAVVDIDGKAETVHVKNTGRCRELLTENAKVYLQYKESEARKTKYDLISVYKGDTLINMDSQAPNKVFEEWLKAGNFTDEEMFIKPESQYGNSRFDFYAETGKRRMFIEVKGVTLEENGIVMFPDAPTQRGLKHVKELCRCIEDGYEAYIFFIVQLNRCKYFTPNYKTHKEFGEGLKVAEEKGVKIRALNCIVTPNELKIEDYVKIKL